ncbi:TyeA family type III secretion system gatekeeper subunit [Succinivibrio dextrinosolvens]|uniref:TyeA family type III secretion system gatekeeper subunit n=1 Tax=Succinivibrio dextrinosolvens TaxID=83771 RepID=UPI0004E26512|nr:TyeA family type III secretion system gatekeeper subunit [Succinivibrio dextrinosolvens]
MSDINGIRNPSGFDHQSVPGNTSTNAPASGGMINGVSVEPADIEKSLFEDSMEEMTFSKDNSKQTKLALRKQKNADARLAELLKKMQAAVAEKVNAKSKTEDILKRTSKVGCTPREIVDSLKSSGGHDAENYALLLQLISKEKDPVKQKLMQDAANEIMQQNEKGIKAVINAMDVSEDNYAGLSILDNAENYSDSLLNFKDGMSMLQFINEKYGEKFEEGLDFITKALSADLEAAQRSHEPAFLRSVADGLEHTKVLYSCFAHEDAMLDRLDKVHGLDVKGFDKVEFVRKLGDLIKSSFVSPGDVRNLLITVKSSDPGQEVVICQELSKTLKDLSDVFYGTPEARERINEACSVLIDNKIQVEDEWLESQQ